MHELIYRSTGPTAIEHAVAANIISENETHLIVCSRSTLSIYEMQKGSGQTVALILFRQYEFQGIITGLQKLRTFEIEAEEIEDRDKTMRDDEKPCLDFLMLSFQEAKACILKYSHELASLSTFSVHHFEQDELHTRAWIPTSLAERSIRVDPSHRCAALPISEDHVAMIPLCHLLRDSFLDLSHQQSMSYSWVVKYVDIDPSIKNVIDICFLHDYYEPTFAILYQPEQTCTTQVNRLPYLRDTVKVAWISMNIEEKKFVLINRKENLPFDCFRLLSLPQSVGGGLIILSNNLIIHLDMSASCYMLSMNQFASSVTSDSSIDCSQEKSLNMTIEGSKILQLSTHSGSLVLITKMGHLYALNIVRIGRSLQRLALEKIAETSTPSCLVPVSSDQFFIGTFTGIASLLIQYTTAGPTVSATAQMDVDDDELYSSKALSSLQSAKSFAASSYLRLEQDKSLETKVGVLAALSRHGPFQDYAVGLSATDKIQWANRSVSFPLQLVGSAGSGSAGSLSIVQASVWPHILTSFPMSVCDEIFTLQLKIATRTKRSDVHEDQTFLILSSATSSMILVTQDKEIREVEISDFYLEGRTIAAGALADSTLAAQVYSTGIRTIKSDGRLVQEISVVDDSSIKFASVLEDHVLIWLESDEWRIYCLSSGSLSGRKSVPWLTRLPFEPSLHLGPLKALTLFRDCQQRFTEVANRVCVSLYLASGSLEIIELPSFKSVFSCDEFYDLPDVLTSSRLAAQSTTSYHVSEHQDIHELLFIASPLGDLYLVARALCGDAYVYQWVKKDFFLKQSHSALLRSTHAATSAMIAGSTATGSNSTTSSARTRSMIPFSNVGGFTGVFMTGARPHWLLLTATSRLASWIPMTVDGAIFCWSPFHSASCNKGFIYMNSAGYLRLGQWPSGLALAASVAGGSCSALMANIHLGRTVNAMAFHGSSHTYVISTNISRSFTLPIDEHTVGSKEPSEESSKESEAARLSPPQPTLLPDTLAYTIELVSPVTWETVDRYELSSYEYVLSLSSVILDSKQTASGKKEFIAVGTGYVRGEDRPTRGRVLLFDVVDVVPDPDNPQTNHKLKPVIQEELKGPVSVVTHIYGYLLTSIGSKIIIHSFSDGESLNGVAFQDVAVYAKSISTIKNFILVGDVYKSILFLVFQEEPPKIVVLGKDFCDLNVQSTEFVANDKHLSLLVADRECNLHAYTYSPFEPNSMSGQKLLHRGDFYFGAPVSKLTRYRPGHETKIHATYATIDGETGLIVQMQEKAFKRLSLLCHKMAHSLYSMAALHPRAHRSAKCSARRLLVPSKGITILDGSYLVRQWNGLSRSKQNFLAKSMGFTVDRIYQDLSMVIPSIDFL